MVGKRRGGGAGHIGGKGGRAVPTDGRIAEMSGRTSVKSGRTVQTDSRIAGMGVQISERGGGQYNWRSDSTEGVVGLHDDVVG